LNIDDANNEFLKIDSTAANSSALGGLTPDAFFQGTGHVVTGAISSLSVGTTPTPLLSVPGGIVVSVANAVGSGLQLEISNPTSQTLAAVVSGSSVSEHNLNPDTTSSMAFPLISGVGQFHMQILPNALFPEVVTLIVSADNGSIVGQAFSGPS
jgi:hypothetical protein